MDTGIDKLRTHHGWVQQENFLDSTLSEWLKKPLKIFGNRYFASSSATCTEKKSYLSCFIYIVMLQKEKIFGWE